MAYDSYTDTNRVRWIVAPPAGTSWYMLAYVADDQDLKYDPVPSDMMASTPPPETFKSSTPGPTAEQVRVIFAELVQKIEEYAKMNRSHVVLQVKASNTALWGILLIGAIILLEENDDRRR